MSLTNETNSLPKWCKYMQQHMFAARYYDTWRMLEQQIASVEAVDTQLSGYHIELRTRLLV